ncbi:MAG: PAS domain-containing protein [Gemmatimonadota bacterium]
MFEKDVSSRAASWNAAMRRLHGLAPDEPVPSREEWRERFVHPDDRDLQHRHAQKLADGNSPYELEYRIRRKDGEQRWLYTRAISVPASGDGRRVLGLTIDITERKRSEERLRLATASTGVGIYERDVETGAAYWDPQMFRLFGLPPATTPPKFEELQQWIHPDDRTRFWQRREELLRAGPAGEFEIRVCGADGVERELLIRTTCERTGDGRVARLAGVAIDVSESRRTARALHEAMERLRLATETSGIGTWERNLLTGEARWDPTMYALYGLQAADGPPPRDVAVRMVHPDDRAVVLSAWQRIQQVTHAVEFEYRLVKADGQIVHLNTRGIAERDTEGRPTRILGATIDITASQVAQSQLREFDQWLRLAGEATSIGFFQVAADGSVHRFDRQISVMYGFDPEGPMPTSAQIEAIVLPEDRPLMHAARTRALQSDEPVDTEYRIRLPDGAVRHLFTRRVRRCDGSGKPIYVVGTSVDVTESRRVQRERDLLYDRMQLAAESLGLGIWDWDLLADTSVWNDQMYALYGRRREECGGRVWSDFVHPEDREHSQSIVSKAIAQTGQCDVEFRVLLPDGRTRWIASRGRVQRDLAGVPVRMIGVSWDVTDKRAAEAALRDKEAAERASQAKSELLSRVSHELRTPLNAILGFAQVLGLDRGNPLTPVQSDRVRQIESAGWHLLNLINEVLELSRIEAGKLSLSLTSVPLAGAVDESVELVSSSAAQRNIAIDLHFDALTPATVRADPTRLKQVLLNLLSNAVKYNRDGGRIDIAIGRAGHEAQISVRDTGHGMSEEQLAQLFQPFNRLGFETSSIEGSGIGLTITRRLVELMGGRIEVSSRSGEGSEFRVRLPVEEELPAVSSPGGMATDASSRPASAATVLYVEDNRSNRELVRELIALRPGIRLLEAASGIEGLQVAASALPDLALIDMRLPDMDGIELLRRLRAAVNGSVPCVVLSADAMPDDRARALQAGFLDYWTKPIVAAEFIEALDRTLSRQRGTARQ